jgi:hypothetical protein
MAVATQPTRSRFFKSQPVGPFELAPDRDRSSDTLVDQANVDTVFADTGWKNTTVNRLCDVEDLLDSLESHGFAEREVETFGNCKFQVRWR